ncbi:MAG TPA: AraC family transcriptional regulator [Polyangia bacterium]|nr:AraC family transcriptional regulator [Polyangia bacterium]
MTRGRSGSSACALARTTMFPFPSSGGAGNSVTVGIVEACPPTDGTFFSFDGPVVTVHLGRPASIRQRREDQAYAWTIARGDMSLIPGGWGTTSWTETTLDFLQVELGPELVRRAAGDAGADVDLPCLFSFDDPLCRELVSSMVAEAQAHGAAARLYVESAGVVLAQRLFSLSRRPVTPVPRAGLPPAVLRRAQEFLHEEMNRNPGVTELSAAVGMNVHHFSRMFKRSTGLSPHQYLGNMRLERAKRMLADGRTRIIEIACEIGYENPSQFSEFFRKRTGLSPSEFRRSVHGPRAPVVEGRRL